MTADPTTARPFWRPSTPADVATICEIERTVHPDLQERAAVHAEKIALFGAGCAVCEVDGAIAGYAASHPWRFDHLPMLDTLHGALPDQPDSLFIHDVALLPAARGRGAAAAFVDRSLDVARRHGLPMLALVSVYGTVPVWQKLGFTLWQQPRFAAKLAGYGPEARLMRRRTAP